MRSQSRGGETTFFFCEALVCTGNSKGCFYFAVGGKRSSFLCFIKRGSSDCFQGLFQLLALAILNAFSSEERRSFSIEGVFNAPCLGFGSLGTRPIPPILYDEKARCTGLSCSLIVYN